MHTQDYLDIDQLNDEMAYELSNDEQQELTPYQKRLKEEEMAWELRRDIYDF